MTADLSSAYPRLGLLDKFIFLAALALATSLFLSVGWLASAPDDPCGAVSLLTHRQAVLMAVQAAGLAAVAAVIATVMIGSKLADAGVFAAALGMALLTLRGQTSAYLLISVSDGDRSAERSLAGELALESVIWFVVLVLAMVVSGLVVRWCLGGEECVAPEANEGSAGRRAGSPRVGLADMAISECPGLWHLAGGGVMAPTGWFGLRATAVVAAVAIFVFCVLVSGSSPRAIQHGQGCFAAFAAFYIGVWVSRRTFPCRTAFWGLLAVPVVCVGGYLWTMLLGKSAGPYADLASVPNSDFLRMLPMAFVAVGVLGVLTAHWTITVSPEPAQEKVKAKRRRSSGR